MMLLCVNLLKSPTLARMKRYPYSIEKLKDPPSFTDFVDDQPKGFLESWFSLDLIWSLIGGIPQDKDGTHSHKLVLGRTSTSRYHPRYFDSLSTKSVNDLSVSQWSEEISLHLIQGGTFQQIYT